MRYVLLFLLLMLAVVPVSAQDYGVFEFEDETGYTGVWSTETSGGIIRQFTDSGSVEIEVTGTTLVIQRRRSADSGTMDIDVNGVVTTYDNAAAETADYPLLIPLSIITPDTIIITAGGNLWLDYYMVLDDAANALPEPLTDSLAVYTISPFLRFSERFDQVVAVNHSVTTGEVVIGIVVFASLLITLFSLMAGDI